MIKVRVFAGLMMMGLGLGLSLGLSLAPNVSHAHEFRPAVLVVEEGPADDGHLHRYSFYRPASGPRGAVGAEFSPRFPAHCQLLSAGDEGRVGTLDCGHRGLVGTIAFDGNTRLGVDVIVEYRRDGGEISLQRLAPGRTEIEIGLGAKPDARGDIASIFASYVALGVSHILGGFDHLLFVGCLVLLVNLRREGRGGVDWRGLLVTISAFTLAHSLTLALSVLDLLVLPVAPVEVCIAASIVLLSRELVLMDPWSLAVRRPQLMALIFGLLHGFGFSSALRELGFPAQHRATALLSFNLGVEAGQLAVVAAMVAALMVVRRAPGAWLRAPAAIIGVVATAWTLEGLLGIWGRS